MHDRFWGKLLRPSTPSTTTKSMNPPNDSPSHPEATTSGCAGAPSLERSCTKCKHLQQQRRPSGRLTESPGSSEATVEGMTPRWGQEGKIIFKTPGADCALSPADRLRSSSAACRLLHTDCA